MRFSDMMGSGDDRPSKHPGPSESEALIADALAPYLEKVAPPDTEPPPEPDAVAPDAVALEVQAAIPVPVPVPVATPAPVVPVAAPERAMSIADLAPVSDDLLPRRR